MTSTSCVLEVKAICTTRRQFRDLTQTALQSKASGRAAPWIDFDRDASWIYFSLQLCQLVVGNDKSCSYDRFLRVTMSPRRINPPDSPQLVSHLGNGVFTDDIQRNSEFYSLTLSSRV